MFRPKGCPGTTAAGTYSREFVPQKYIRYYNLECLGGFRFRVYIALGLRYCVFAGLGCLGSVGVFRGNICSLG